jgi:hypothetical protein
MAYVPGQKSTFKAPPKITLAKVLVASGLVALVYFSILFIPPYYRSYRASSVLQDESSKTYSRRHQKADWSEVENKIQSRVRKRLLSTLKIPRTQLKVRIQKKPNHMVITASWSVYAKWPLLNKETRLEFNETVKTSLR